MSEVKTRENGFNEEVINSFRNGIPENWRDVILKHHVALSSIPVESSMKFQDPPKETESKVEEKEPLDRDVSKPKRQTKKRKGTEFRPPRMVVLDKPVEKVCIDEELNVPVRRSSRHHQPPLPFWENSYMIYNERLGRSEVVIGPNSHVEMVDGYSTKREQQVKIEVEDEEEDEEEEIDDDNEIDESEDEDEDVDDSMIELKPKSKSKSKSKSTNQSLKPKPKSKSKSKLQTNILNIQIDKNNNNTIIKPTTKTKSKTVSKPKSQNSRKSTSTVPKVPPKELHVSVSFSLSNIVDSGRD